MKNKKNRGSSELKKAKKQISIIGGEREPKKKKALLEDTEKLLLSSFQKGNKTAAFELAQQYDEYGIFGENIKKAIDWYRRAHANGHAEATNNLAHFYETGRGVKKNEKTARKMYLLAAKRGSENAQFNVGIDLISQNVADAVTWLKKSLKKGNSSAALKLAEIYSSSDNLRKKRMALSYLKKIRFLSEEEEVTAKKLKANLKKYMR